jgi:trans-2,3-dihydro-3-hydroxyanthranilate isomerase
MSPVELILKKSRAPLNVKESTKIAVKQVDAFTETPLTGNPACVVMDATNLSDQQMQTIARELSVPETAFILPALSPKADLRIRWFSPQSEVPLCGHATIASFHALAEEGMKGMRAPGSYNFNVETKSGILPVTVEKGAMDIEVLFGLPIPKFVRAGQYKLDLMRILGIALDDFENRMPIVMTEYLYVPIRRLHTIFSMKPNFFAMSQFLTNRKLSGVCVFTMETVERKSSVHSRFFAPTVGINEDPVTGSSNGPLGVYLFQQGELEQKGETITIVGEQGDVIGRKGRVTIQLGVQGSEVMSVRIGGRATTIFDGTMIIA